MVFSAQVSCLYKALRIKIMVLTPKSFYFLANQYVSRALFRVIHTLIVIISVTSITVNKVFLLQFPGCFL